MDLILDPLTRRRMGRCFYLVISLENCDEEIKAAIEDAMQVERAVEAVLNGDASIWESLEAVEECVLDVDQYCQEVEQNLYETLLQCQLTQ